MSYRIWFLSFIGLILALFTFVLYESVTGVTFPWQALLYAFAVALIVWAIGFTWEMYVRKKRMRAWRTWLHVLNDRFLSLTPDTNGASRLEMMIIDGLRRRDKLWRDRLSAQDDKLTFLHALSLRFAHQLKTPLAALSLLLEEAQARSDKNELEAAWPSLEQAMRVELDRSSALLQQMISTARITHIDADLTISRFSVEELLREVINAYRASWIAHHIYPRLIIDFASPKDDLGGHNWITGDRKMEGARKEESTVLQEGRENPSGAGRRRDTVVSDRKWLRLMFEQIIQNALKYGRKESDPQATFLIFLGEHLSSELTNGLSSSPSAVGVSEASSGSSSVSTSVTASVPSSVSSSVTASVPSSVSSSVTASVPSSVSLSGPSGGPPSASQSIHVAFIDSGPGIPESDLNRLFEPFYTGESGRKQSASTGLGLYLAKEAARAIGAQINIETCLGVGTTVHVIIPRDHFYAPAMHTQMTETHHGPHDE
ncbi:MAG: sensor histidine kinase [Candidatus Carbobacillus altaicus]|nr:sensor histidine kinase [Candidatus Carbobacillus altaicus]